MSATSGSIGAFDITTASDPLGTGFLKTSVGTYSSSITGSEILVSTTPSPFTIAYASRLRGFSTRVSSSPSSGNSFASDLLFNGVQTVTTDGYVATNFFVRSGLDLILSSGSGYYVYARNDGSAGTPSSSFRVTVGTGGVSTKIIKDQINEIDYNSVDQFFNLINIKTYQNLLNNKPNISLIIEDEEEKNVPFKDLLFIKENRLVIYNKEVPT
jgi:hypothetical protein